MASMLMMLVTFVSYSTTLKAVSHGELLEREPLQPIFNTTTVNITAFAGDRVTLPCTLEYNGQSRSYNLIWLNPRVTLISQNDVRFIDDSRMSIERPKVKDWNLLIRDVRYNDSGEYMCQISTTPVMIRRVYLFIKVAPEIIEYSMQSPITVNEGDTVELMCNATGVPLPVVTWHKLFNDGSTDDLLDPIGGRSLQGEVLILHNISRYCDGKYECTAENGVPPMAFKVFEVIVMFPPEVTVTGGRIGQEVGKQTVLECKSRASPQGQIMWSRNGQVLPTLPHKYSIELFSDGGHVYTLSLNIINLEKEDFGRYTCSALNKLGQDSEDMILYEYRSITERPTMTPLPQPPPSKPHSQHFPKPVDEILLRGHGSQQDSFEEPIYSNRFNSVSSSLNSSQRTTAVTMFVTLFTLISVLFK